MKIAILSDIHENFHNLILTLKEIESRDVEQIIFLGDFMNAGIATLLSESPTPIFAIWGNNDGDKPTICRKALQQGSNLTMSDNVYHFLEFDNRKIFITHFPDLAKPMAKTGDFDAVFYGHNHLKNEDKIGNCLIVNPGEISAHKTGKATFAIYDTKENSAEFVDVKNAITLKTETVDEYFKKNEDKILNAKSHKY